MNASVSADTPHGHELVDDLVSGVVASVEHEMSRKPAWMVLEILTATLARRLPGMPVDVEAMKVAAARIAIGFPASAGVLQDVVDRRGVAVLAVRR